MTTNTASGRIVVDYSGVTQGKRGAVAAFRDQRRGLNAANRQAQQVRYRRNAVTIRSLQGQLATVAASANIVNRFGLRSADRLRQVETRYRQLTGDQEDAVTLMTAIREQANDLGIPEFEALEALAGLGATLDPDELADYTDIVARLNTLNPQEGPAGAVFAIREALASDGGDLVSLAERFNISRVALREAIDATGDVRLALDAVLNDMQVSSAQARELNQSLGVRLEAALDEMRAALATGYDPYLDFATDTLNSLAALLDALAETNPELLQLAAGASLAAGGYTALLTGLSSRAGLAGVSVIAAGALGIGAARGVGAVTGDERLQGFDMGQLKTTLSQLFQLFLLSLTEAARQLELAIARFPSPGEAFREAVDIMVNAIDDAITAFEGLLPDRVLAVADRLREPTAPPAREDRSDAINARYDQLQLDIALAFNPQQPVAVAAESISQAVTQIAESPQGDLVNEFDAQVARLAELNRLDREGTVDAVFDRVRGLVDERNAITALLPELEALAGASEETDEKIAAARARLQAIDGELRDLAATAPVAFGRDAAELLTTYRERAAELDARFAEDVAGFSETLGTTLADLDARFADDKAKRRAEERDALDQFQDDEIRRVRAHRDRLEEIATRSRIEVATAAAALDETALVTAQRSARTATETQIDRFDLESEAADDRLDDLRERLAAERQDALDAYRTERETALAAYRVQVEDAGTKHRMEVAAAKSLYDFQLERLNQRYQQEIQLTEQGTSAVLDLARRFVESTAQRLGAVWREVLADRPRPLQVRNIPQFSGGGVMPGQVMTVTAPNEVTIAPAPPTPRERLAGVLQGMTAPPDDDLAGMVAELARRMGYARRD